MRTSNPTCRSAALQIRLILLLSLGFSAAQVGCGKSRPPSVQGKFSTNIPAAAVYGDLQSVKKSVEAQPEVVTGNYPGWSTSLLHKAAEGGQLEIIAYLLSKGADPNVRDDRGWTPLHVAAAGDSLATFKSLVAAGTDISARVENRFEVQGELRVYKGKNALSFAARHGQAENVKYLLSHGTPVVYGFGEDPSGDGPGETALHWACCPIGSGDEGEDALKLTNAGVIDALAAHVEDMNLTCFAFQRRTPLQTAAACGAAGVVEHLLKTYPKVKINTTEGTEGDSPLHLAVRDPGYRVPSAYRAATVRVLLQNGAALSVRNPAGKTAVQEAKALGDPLIIAAFEETQADSTGRR